MSQEGELKELRSEVSELQGRVRGLEGERETLLASQRTASEEQTDRARILEKVVQH